MNPRVAIVGATGAVGRTFLSLLEERRFPVGALRMPNMALLHTVGM